MITGLLVDIESGRPRFRESPWRQFSGAILSGSTQVVDELNVSEFSSLVYELSFFNVSMNQTKNLTLRVGKQGSTVTDQVFGRIGLLNVSVDTLVVGSLFNLSVQNNESFSVNYCLTVLTS